jgi:hypothetical protein
MVYLGALVGEWVVPATAGHGAVEGRVGLGKQGGMMREGRKAIQIAYRELRLHICHCMRPFLHR